MDHTGSLYDSVGSPSPGDLFEVGRKGDPTSELFKSCKRRPSSGQGGEDAP